MARIPYRHRLGGGFVDRDCAQRIHGTALHILQEVGLAVPMDSMRERMATLGYRTSGERVFFEPAVVEEHLAARRRRLAQDVLSAHHAAQVPAALDEAEDDGKLYLTAQTYCHHVHDLDTDRVVPYTTASLIEMTRLVDVLTERGVRSPAPGYPLDVPPPLQPLVQYRVGAMYSRHGDKPVDPISVPVVPYVWEMAEVMGHPVHGLSVYVTSPLRLAGESFEVVMRYRDRLQHVQVNNMPAVGASVPVLPFGALAVAAAEVIGGFIVLSEVTGLEVDFSPSIFAFDLRLSTLVYASPEAYLFGQLNAEINEFYTPGHPRGRGNSAAGLNTRANFPGAQAAAEKASLMTAGALIGARWFHGAGTLSLDELFSAEQLLVDLEIRDHVARLLQGLEMGEGGYDWVDEVRRGVEGSFMALDSTLDHYRETYWHPQLFDRGFLASQGPDGRLKLLERVRDMVQGYVARHDYELDGVRRLALDRIYERATRELT